MTAESNPTYAANAAWSRAKSMVSRLRDYLRSPRAPEDRASDLSGLVEEADAILAALEEVRPLLNTAHDGVPDVRVIRAVERAVQFEVDVVVGTEIQKHVNPEGDKFDIVRLLATARSADGSG
jgi:hypothetical protein